MLPEAAGAGRFDLNPAQSAPPVAFVELATLRDVLGLSPVRPSRRNPDGRAGRVNAVFVKSPGDEPPDDADELNAALRDSLTLADLRLTLRESGTTGARSLESGRMILEPAVADATRAAAESVGLVAVPRYVALVNAVQPSDPVQDDEGETDRRSAYFVVAGVTPDDVPAVADAGGDGIVLNRFLAEDQLGVGAGDRVTLRWYPVDDGADAAEESETFTVAAVVPVEGPAADDTLTPTVEGITDADGFADWDQPFAMDLSRVTDADELYWDEYRALPKAFLPVERMRDLFPSRYGDVTSVSLRRPDGEPVSNDDADRFAAALVRNLDARALGLAFGPVKANGLAAAAGTTDFSGLFVGFSVFLIGSAAILIALLFRLGLERRASEVGLERALGVPPATVRRLHLAEGLAVVTLGGLLGTAGAVAYAAALLWGLRTVWVGAVGTRELELAVTPPSLLIGFAASVLLAAAAVWWGLRRLRGATVRGLLAGEPGGETDATGRRAGLIAVGTGAFAAVVGGAAAAGLVPNSEAFAGFGWDVVAFFLVGAALLACVVAALGWWLARRPGGTPRSGVALGLRNAARERGRSVLTAGLIACATFLLVAVAAARKDPSAGLPEKESGNGGFLLVAEAAAPLPFDPSTPSGREELGLTGEPFAAVDDVQAFRVRPGADASCLNLYRTGLPTVLGVPDSQIERGGFAFADTPGENPWELLKQPLPEADGLPVFPVLGDMNTLQYSLKLAVGDRIAVPDDANPVAYFEVVGKLDGSVFQGVLLTGGDSFEELFPQFDGWGYLLVDAPVAAKGELAAALEGSLSNYGVDAEPVGDRIASFLAVQNTYLSTFQALGGLGLLLGTLGLAAVMLRNVLDRRGELALLRAVGLGTRKIAALVLTETAFLLLWGLAGGTAAALLALWPHLSGRTADAPWVGGALTLLAVFAAGMLASLWAVRAAVRTPIVATLRGE